MPSQVFRPDDDLMGRLLAVTSSGRRPDWASARKELRNQLRRYSATSIAQAAMNILWHPAVDEVEKLRFAPWHTLLLVKVALQDNLVPMTNAPAISQEQFDVLRRKLWNVAGAGTDPINIQLFFRQLLHAQVEFQRKPTFSFMRQPALISRLPSNHKLYLKFNELFGFDPDTYIDLAFTAAAAVLDKRRVFSKAWFAPLIPVYSEGNIDRFLSHIMRDLPGLREELRTIFGQQRPSNDELFEFPIIKQFPLLRHPNGHIECWHPLVFARGLEDLVHSRFATLGKWYSDRYSKVFESYVVELIADARLPHLDESDLKSKLGDGASVPDAVIDLPDCNVFVESKMGLFDDALLVEGDPEHLRRRTKSIRKAIRQGWEMTEALRSGAFAGQRCSEAAEDFLFVVANRELNLSRGELLASMYPDGGIPYPSERAGRYLPLSHVFFVSIDEFECLMGSLRDGEGDLSTILHEAVAANDKPSTSTYYFSDHLRRAGRGWGNSDLIQRAVDASMARLSCVRFSA